MIHGSLAVIFQGSVENAIGNSRPVFHLHGNALKEWFQAFKAFMKTTGAELSDREWRCCTFLETQYIAMSILASTMSQLSEVAFDTCESDFARIAALAQLANVCTGTAPNDGSIQYPSFDMGILPPLCFVASRCRNPVLRRQAVGLLRRGTWREGI